MKLQMDAPLNYPSSKKWKGLTIFCYKCKTGVSEICKDTGKPINRCPFGDRHAFKVSIHVPGSDNARKTRTLETRDVNEAIKQAMDFEREVKYSFQTGGLLPHDISKVHSVRTPQLLSHVFARYIGFLHNEEVPSYRQKIRSPEHIKDVERALKLFAETLKKNQINIHQTLITQLNEKMVGMIYDRMENEKHFSSRSINKILSYLTSMITWYVDEYDVPIKNWFGKVPRKKIVSNPKAITKDEFEMLLGRIIPENGIKDYKKGKKPVRNLYRSWLPDAFSLALETGRRREEVISLRFDNIINDNNGSSYIKVEDFKVNRIQKLNENEKRYIYIPITSNLKKLLNRLRYENQKNSSNYILAPEITTSRTRVMADILSKGFSHFYEQLETGRKLTFKSLRKAYITSMQIHTGGNAKSVTGHSDNAVIEKHYLDREAIAKSIKGFQVFNETPKRDEDIRKVRAKSRISTNNLEQSK
jgi:integrase